MTPLALRVIRAAAPTRRVAGAVLVFYHRRNLRRDPRVILYHNIARIVARSLAAERVLDVGGGSHPLNAATHVLDFTPYARRGVPLDPETPERFSEATWHVADACVAPWPFPDGFFDWSFCSHILEDVRDPIAMVKELRRVARAGYIETPSRAREIFAKARFASLRRWLGRGAEIGFYHHRWFVELEGSCLRFTAKTAELARDTRYYITRGEIGRKLGEEESGLCLWWEGELSAIEIVPVSLQEDLRAFKAAALPRLRGRRQ